MSGIEKGMQNLELKKLSSNPCSATQLGDLEQVSQPLRALVFLSKMRRIIEPALKSCGGIKKIIVHAEF